MNALLEMAVHPRFDVITTEDVVPALSQVLAEATQRLEALEADLEPTWAGLMVPLSDLQEPLEFAWGVVNHLMGVANSPELREAHDQVQPDVVSFSLRLGQSAPIFAGLNAMRSGEVWESLDQPQRRIIESSILHFENAVVVNENRLPSERSWSQPTQGHDKQHEMATASSDQASQMRTFFHSRQSPYGFFRASCGRLVTIRRDGDNCFFTYSSNKKTIR